VPKHSVAVQQLRIDCTEVGLVPFMNVMAKDFDHLGIHANCYGVATYLGQRSAEIMLVQFNDEESAKAFMSARSGYTWTQLLPKESP
jgi:hypothetical protein